VLLVLVPEAVILCVGPWTANERTFLDPEPDVNIETTLRPSEN